jgi:hypothetical protein
MSSHVQDFPASSVVIAGRYPYPIAATTTGAGVNLAAGDGPCFAIQVVGDAPGDGSLDGHVEQSDDGTTWSAIPGATFTQVPGPDNLQIIRFTRSARLLRWVGTLGGADPQFTVTVLFGQQKKTL